MQLHLNHLCLRKLVDSRGLQPFRGVLGMMKGRSSCSEQVGADQGFSEGEGGAKSNKGEGRNRREGLRLTIKWEGIHVEAFTIL